MEYILSLLIHIFVFVIQILAPLITLIFLIITFFIQTKALVITFNVFAILYIIGYFTSTLAVKKNTRPINLIPLFRTNPWFNTLLEMSFVFIPSFIIAFIISFVLKDFTFFLRYVVLINWSSRIIVYFTKSYIKSKRYKESIKFNDYIESISREYDYLIDDQEEINSNNNKNTNNCEDSFDD